MQLTDVLQILFRWTHIVAGILWIGLLYFFNWVNGQFSGAIDADTKKKVVPELMPRALYWFRWGAAWTWTFGVLMLWLVFWGFWGGGNAALPTATAPWTAGGIIMTIFLFVAPFIYELLAQSGLGKNNKTFAVVGFILIALVVWLFQGWGGLGYRGWTIYTGAMFGTIMAYNVWFRIWPAQKKIIAGVKTGPPADPAVAALAGARSRHNTYLSVPLIWAMINAHSTFLDGCWGCWTWLLIPAAVLIGWLVVMWIYKKAATVKGF